MDNITVSASEGIAECPMVSDDMEGICVIPDLGTIKTEQSSIDDPGNQNVSMGIKFILPNRFDMNVCSRFVKSLNEEDSKNIQDQVNSDLEVASVLFKGTNSIWCLTSEHLWVIWHISNKCFVLCLFSWVQYSDLSISRHTSATRLHTIHHQTFLPN